MYEWSLNSIDESEHSFVVVGIARDSSNKPMLCYSVLAKTLPEYIDAHSDLLSVRRFLSGERLLESGDIIHESNAKGKGISLDGYIACWIPKSDCVVNRLMQSYYELITKDMVNIIEGHKEAHLNCSYEVIDTDQLSRMIKNKKVAFFTGAGISIKAGVVNLEELMSLQQSIFTPIEQYFYDIVKGHTIKRLDMYKLLYSMFTEAEPTQSHSIIKELCDLYGITLITGNIDGLHEKTGMKPIFQNSDKVVIPEFDTYDILVTIGLSDKGIGEVAEEFHSNNPNGLIIAINKTAPRYLSNKDYFIEGEADNVLADLKYKLQNS